MNQDENQNGQQLRCHRHNEQKRRVQDLKNWEKVRIQHAPEINWTKWEKEDYPWKTQKCVDKNPH